MSHLLSPVACMLQAHASRPSLMTPPIFRYATLNGCEVDQLCCCHKSAARCFCSYWVCLSGTQLHRELCHVLGDLHLTAYLSHSVVQLIAQPAQLA